MTGMTDRYIFKLTKRLEDANALHVERPRSKRGKRKRNVYHLDPATAPRLQGTSKPGGDQGNSSSGGPGELGFRSARGTLGSGTDTTTDRNRETPTPSRSRSAGMVRSSDRSAGGNTSSTRAKRQPTRSATTKQNATSAAAAGPRSPRARTGRGKSVHSRARFRTVRIASDGTKTRFERNGHKPASSHQTPRNGHAEVQPSDAIASWLADFYASTGIKVPDATATQP